MTMVPRIVNVPLKLRSLDLNQFRCFENLQAELHDGITIFHGDNAQGKTSILEAICVLLRLQSPRTSNLAECARFEGNQFALGGTIESDDTTRLRFQHRESGRRLIVDGETQKRAADYLRHTSLVVWMASDDLALIRGGAEGRRRYLDFMASQLFPDYRPALKAYEKAVRSRNFLLKRDASPQWQQIDAYTRILHEQGLIITRRRRELTTALDPYSSTAQFEISGRNSEDLQIRYRPASGDNDDLRGTLGSLRMEEGRKRRTLAGPHLDDLELSLNGMAAAKFASEGQQRTIALALKLAQTQLFLQMGNRPPILLIDDVFGELDPSRRNYLMATWPENLQKIITTTHLGWLDDRFSNAERIRVRDSTLHRD